MQEYAGTETTVIEEIIAQAKAAYRQCKEESRGMRIIAKGHLMALARQHGDCVQQVQSWYTVTSRERWHSLSDVRQTYRTADQVGDKTVFNIKGNNYRLIVYIRYDTGIVYIKDLLTHAEYDRDKWKS